MPRPPRLNTPLVASFRSLCHEHVRHTIELSCSFGIDAERKSVLSRETILQLRFTEAVHSCPSWNRVPTRFQTTFPYFCKTFSIPNSIPSLVFVFPKFYSLNTISHIACHWKKICCFIFCKTVTRGKGQNLNKQMAEYVLHQFHCKYARL